MEIAAENAEDANEKDFSFRVGGWIWFVNCVSPARFSTSGSSVSSAVPISGLGNSVREKH